MCWKCHSWAPPDGGAAPSYGGGNSSQIAVTHTQSRIKDGPLAATSCNQDFLESFWKLLSHKYLYILDTVGPLWVVI